jgi:hypothetical protein
MLFYAFVGFEVFTAVIMTVAIFVDIAPCNPYVDRCFGGTYNLHHQGRSAAGG